MKKSILITAFFALLAGAAGYAYFSLFMPVPHEDATLVVAHGTPMTAIAKQLSRAGVIKQALPLTVYSRISGADRRIKPGEYIFENGLKPLQVLSKLERGDVKLYKITLIEGWSVSQMADYLAEQPFAWPSLKDEFKTAAVEGYLFPSTYFIPRPKTASEIIERIEQEFNKIYTPELDARAKEINLTLLQVITLASIIEKETGSPEERPLISSVFHNRLKKGIPLQSDPTTIYGLKDFDGNLRKSDLSSPHPYNTYVHKGLPPGPIANPGLDSIKAALWPADSDYIFFVSKNDGTHQFSRTLAEHNQAVLKYQLGR